MNQQVTADSQYPYFRNQPISLQDLPSHQYSQNHWTGDNSFQMECSGVNGVVQVNYPNYLVAQNQSQISRVTPQMNHSFQNQSRSPLQELNMQRNSMNNLIQENENENNGTKYVAFQLPSIMCTKGKGHSVHAQHDSPLTMVCVDRNCLDNNQFLLCTICSQTDHQFHEQVPLKLLVHDIIACMNEKKDSPKKLSNKLANLRAESLQRIKEIRQKISQRLDEIEQEIIFLYETLQEHQIKQVIRFSQKDVLEGIDNLMNCKTKEQLQAEIRNIMNNTHIDNGNGNNFGVDILNEAIAENTLQDIGIKHENLTKMLINLQKSCEELLQDKEKLVANFTINCNESFSVHPALNSSAVAALNNHSALQENIIQHKNTIYDPDYANKKGGLHGSGDSFNNIPVDEPQSILQTSFMSHGSKSSNVLTQRFEFSKTMRDPNIVLQRRVIINGNYDANNEKLHYRVQLVLPELETTTPSIKQWSFKIARQLPHWIGFGVCHVNDIKKQQFKLTNSEFSFTHQEGQKKSNDHGCYLITTHGWAFGHKSQPQRTNLRFSKNDIVTCRFDPFKNFIIFYKNNDFQNPYNLSFESICWNKLYPCVVFWYPGDSVELL
ncbi:hypothetical protein ABPG74_022583 [Tetrahymena malaccensis]